MARGAAASHFSYPRRAAFTLAAPIPARGNFCVLIADRHRQHAGVGARLGLRRPSSGCVAGRKTSHPARAGHGQKNPGGQPHRSKPQPLLQTGWQRPSGRRRPHGPTTCAGCAPKPRRGITWISLSGQPSRRAKNIAIPRKAASLAPSPKNWQPCAPRMPTPRNAPTPCDS